MEPSPKPVRLQKIIADAGMCSRRDAEALITQGKVTVDGVVAPIGTSLDPHSRHTIIVNGKPLQQTTGLRYIMLHKPTGFVSSTVPEGTIPPITDLVQTPQRLYPVGRLDVDTEGLILLTNDGAFSHHLTHPSHEIPKTYQVLIRKTFKPQDAVWLKGSPLIEERPVDVRTIKVLDPHCIEITIHEGRKHIIKKLIGALGHHVDALRRIRIGSLELGSLPIGTWRDLTPQEVTRLMQTDSKKSHTPKPSRVHHTK